jgi:hypothetical protein
MAGLLWREVRAQGAESRAHMELARHAVAQAATNRGLARTLREVLAQLEPAGIRVATCKGVALEEQLYGEAGARHTSDVDLVLHPHDIARSLDVVEVLTPGHRGARQQAELAIRGVLAAFTLTVNGVDVDVHAAPLKAGRPRDAMHVWSRMRAIDLPGVGSVLAPTPELAFVLGLVNMSRDRFRWLLFEADVVRCTTLPDFDWTRVRDIVVDEDLQGIVPPAWRAVARDLDLDDGNRFDPSRRVRTAVWQLTFPPRARLRGDDVVLFWRHKALGLNAARSNADALRAVRDRFLPAPEWIELLYPGRGPWWWPWLKNIARHRVRWIARVLRRGRSAGRSAARSADATPADD